MQSFQAASRLRYFPWLWEHVSQVWSDDGARMIYFFDSAVSSTSSKKAKGGHFTQVEFRFYSMYAYEIEYIEGLVSF